MDRENGPRTMGRLAVLWRRLPARVADLLSSRRARVQGPSMEPTLRDGDMVLVSRAAYARSAPARGDVVLLRVPQEGVEYIKRLVGLPGENVTVQNGRVAINGSPLAEPYVDAEGLRAGGVRDGEWRLGEGEYFALGDNRGDSWDSRAFGPVHRRWVLGRVWYRYSPAGRTGALPAPPP